MADTLVNSSVSNRRLQGKVALITGGTSGMGEATVRLFIKHGAKVCIADIQDKLREQTHQLLGSGTHACFIHCDVTKEDDIRKAVDFTVETFGVIDIMVNNADITGNIVLDIREFDLREFKKVYEVNVNGVFLGMKHAARVMIPRGKGSIISIASVASTIGGVGSHSYTGSKHAVLGFTKSLAETLGRYGIRVNCVSPYVVPSGVTPPHLQPGEKNGDDVKGFFAAIEPHANLKGVHLEDDDVAEAMLFLASDEARFVSGLNMVLDGGFSVVNSQLQPCEV